MSSVVPTSGRTGPNRPPRSDVLLLCVGVLSGSAAGPLAASVVVASGLTIAFWRLLAGSLVAAPLGVVRSLVEVPKAGRRTVALAVAAGVLIAAQFTAYMTSLSLTSVASATAVVNSQIVWAAVIARVTGVLVSKRVWWGVGIALFGVAAITGFDLSLSAAAVTGDLIALLGGVFGGAYNVIGGHVRQRLSSPTYTLLCYGSGALVLLPVCLLTGQRLVGLPAHDWLVLLGLTVFAQLIGQNVFNFVLRTISPTLVSLGQLFTAPIAGALAWIFIGQVPPVTAAGGLVVLIVGAALVISGSMRGPGHTTDPEPKPVDQ